MTAVEAMLAECRSHLGYGENPPGSNINMFSAALGRPAEAWCADFAVYCADKVGLSLPSRSASTATMAHAFEDAGAYYQTPRIGDFCFIYHPELGRIGHVCIVEAENPAGGVITINGNSNVVGGRVGGLVCRNIRRVNIAGYGRPAYSIARPVPPTPKPHTWPVMRVGLDGAAVAELQRALNAHGALPKLRVDGSFGPMTSRAVKDFQRRRRLDVDGVVGPITASFLI